MKPITISTLTTHIVSLFESDDLLRDVWVIGEVSNWKRAASGHIYFSMKDGSANISAVMWRGSALSQSWLPKAGDQILAHGYVGIYPERGVYQLYVNRIQPAGRGQLYAEFEALKERLDSAGLFDVERKRPIVEQPRRIGIVTSADAAALRDILRVLSVRWPLVEIFVFSTLVQGAQAPVQIVSAIQTANRYSQHHETLDTLILARGGGSIEDLWAFNDEQVAYAIVASELPVISGIGHETDFTIADFVADARLPTPSAAAAAAVPDKLDTLDQLQVIKDGLQQRASERIAHAKRLLQQSQARLQRVHPKRQFDLRRQQLDDRERRLHDLMDHQLNVLTARRDAAQARLNALNPLAVLGRGYSIVQKQNASVVTNPEQVSIDEKLIVRAAEGEYRVRRTE